MKVAILGPVIHSTVIELGSKFDKLGFNSGHSVTEIGGPYVKLAKELAADGHQVMMLCELGNQIDPYIIRYLKDAGINTEHIVAGSNGLVVSEEFRYGGEFVRHVSSKYSTDSIRSYILRSQEEIFDDLNVLVFGYIDPPVLDACKDYDVSTIWCAAKEDIEGWDYDDPDTKYIKDVPTFSFEDSMHISKSIK